MSQNKYERRGDGLRAKIEALRDLMAKKHRDNEQENNKGFSKGGAQEEVNEKEADAEMAMLEQELSEAQKQQEINNLLLNNECRGDEKEGDVIDAGNDKAMRLAQDIAEKYHELGFQCEISVEENNVRVAPIMPQNFKGRDPLEMSSKELQQARQENFMSAANSTPSAAPASPITANFVHDVLGKGNDSTRFF